VERRIGRRSWPAEEQKRWESSGVPDGVVCGCVVDRAAHLPSLIGIRGSGVGNRPGGTVPGPRNTVPAAGNARFLRGKTTPRAVQPAIYKRVSPIGTAARPCGTDFRVRCSGTASSFYFVPSSGFVPATVCPRAFRFRWTSTSSIIAVASRFGGSAIRCIQCDNNSTRRAPHGQYEFRQLRCRASKKK
jgi:hypothetical protein